MMESGLMFLGYNFFDKDVVFENKCAAVNFLKNKCKHLKNLEIYTDKSGNIDIKNIYSKLKNANNGEVFYAIGFGKKIYSHTSAFVYGKLDDTPFIMYFKYPQDIMYILNSKIASDKKITKMVIPAIQNDNCSCFIFQTKMLQTMSPKVILDIIKDKRFACNTETIYDIRKTNYYTYGVNCPYIDVGTEQLPQDLLSYMQSVSKINQLNNGDDILKKNKDKGYIKSLVTLSLPAIVKRRTEKEINVKPSKKISSLFSEKRVNDDFFNDLYSVKSNNPDDEAVEEQSKKTTSSFCKKLACIFTLGLFPFCCNNRCCNNGGTKNELKNSCKKDNKKK